MNRNPKLIAFAQAVGLTVYISFIAFFIQNAQNWFGPQKDDQMFGVMIFLLIFVISALVSASMILGYPAILFFKGKRKSALKIVLQSILWLIIFLTAILFFTLRK